MKEEDEELGASIASSVSNNCVEEAADQIAAALVRATASSMSRCLIGEAEAAVVRFLQVLDGNLPKSM